MAVSKELLIQLRNKNSWSQEQLAAICGLSQRTIQRIERDGNCSLESKMAIASAFGVALHDLDDKVSLFTDKKHNGQSYDYISILKELNHDAFENHSLFLTLCEVLPLGVSLFNANGKCVYLNKAWQDCTGLAPVNALGDGWLSAIHPQNTSLVKENWSETLKNQTEMELNFSIVHLVTKNVVKICGQFKPLFDEKNRYKGHLCINIPQPSNE